MMRMLICLAVLAAAIAITSTPPAAAADDAAAAPPTYYLLVLDKAMFSGNNLNEARELVMDLVQYGDDWGAIYAVSRNYNMPFHKGAVHEATVKGDQITLKIGTVITPDKWIKGGQGQYTIKLKRDGERLQGTFSGEYNGEAVSGTAVSWTFTSTCTSRGNSGKWTYSR